MVRVVRRGEGTKLDLPGRRSFEIIGASQGSSSSTFRIVEIAPGPAVRNLHFHDGFEEVIHILEGTGVLRAGQTEIPVTPGDTCLIPAGVRHATINTGEQLMRLMCFFPVNDIKEATHEIDEKESG